MGGSGGSVGSMFGKGRPGGTGALDYMVNPIGAATKKFTGVNPDVFSQVTAAALQNTWRGAKGEAVVDPLGDNALSEFHAKAFGGYTGDQSSADNRQKQKERNDTLLAQSAKRRARTATQQRDKKTNEEDSMSGSSLLGGL